MKKILLITGMSGAGKTTAMQILDDMGYHCIDRFPVELLNSLYELVENEDGYEHVCLTASAIEYPIFYNFFKSKNLKIQTVFLDCNDEQLILRYKFTRRQHPFLISKIVNTLEEAIESERKLFSSIKTKNILKIDTTKTTKYDLKEILEKHASINNQSDFTISFVSFGYKHGIPIDADIALDIRYLPNPYYDEQLRHLTGNDSQVYNFVLEQSESKEAIKNLLNFFNYIIPQYAKDGRSHLTIAIGCTGGRHRSVSFVNYFYDYYREKYHCLKKHRDAEGRS